MSGSDFTTSPATSATASDTQNERSCACPLSGGWHDLGERVDRHNSTAPSTAAATGGDSPMPSSRLAGWHPTT